MTNARTFTVEGRGLFPFDMLRYDACYPSRQEDAHNIYTTVRLPASHTDPVRVTLTCAPDVPNRPTTARWESFGWKVVES